MFNKLTKEDACNTKVSDQSSYILISDQHFKITRKNKTFQRKNRNKYSL